MNLTEAIFDDPDAKTEFERGLKELDAKLKPMTDAMDASERITEKDLEIRFNVTD